MDEEVKSILIVDDDEAILEVIKEIFEMEGFKVDTASTGREAIEKSEARYYNLALLDIKLPDMEGTELLEKLHKEVPKMMKIMITGYPSLENSVKSLNLGADAYIMKPIEPEELLRVVRKKLKEQEEVERMSKEKMTEWIETRIRKLEQKYQMT
ncbi:MAG: response regulator receiver domain-containing protein [Candidatus Bathyarchaeota archaeon B26-2]|nr:MAG: response regulator receiver domain-containing protein [Candidatus Bathyarchaeota archaeon B26-2]